MVRLPVVFLEKILEVAQYMDQNDGRLPFSEAFEDLIIISGHSSESLSGEELKELSAKRKAQKLAQKVMAGDEEVVIGDETFKELP
jgi:outer membrane protein OmpA-like peptidoglycan-associated protein